MGLSGCANGYRSMAGELHPRAAACSFPVFLAACAAVFLLVPWLGQDFFPAVDAGRFNLHFRAKTGTRIEETRENRRTDGSRRSAA